MKKLLAGIVILLLVLSCDDDKKIPPEIECMVIDMRVERFDELFAKSDSSDLQALKNQFPYLFSSRYPDEYWYQKFTDTIQIEINTEVAKAFPDFDQQKASLETLFKHIKFYFPTTTVPKIVTIATEPDYRGKVVLADSLLLIGLTSYLGTDHHFYTGIPRFQARSFREEQIDVDVAAAFAKEKVSTPRNKEFLSQLIYEGKQLYLMKELLSLQPESEILGYTEDELTFARENEQNIWEFFIKNELLYDTDSKLLSRFIDPAPFSKFYLEFDNETPGRLGRYIGYEIVSSYMQKNDVPLKTMLFQDAATIFAAAKYKP